MSFDRLAKSYRLLEGLAFGRSLEKARFAQIDSLFSARKILLLGDGDGRFLKELLTRAPTCQVESIDASAAMLRRARSRLSEREAARVTFRQSDLLAPTLELGENRFDAITTVFFLDCFTEHQLRPLISKIHRALKPKGLLLYVDFHLPASGWRRLRARLWLTLLYAAFRWQTGLSAKHLAPAPSLLQEAGFSLLHEHRLQADLLLSLLLTKTAATPAPVVNKALHPEP